MIVYVRNFKSSHVKESNTFKNIYFPEPMQKAFRKSFSQGYIKLNDYILGPVYKNGMIQLGVTGTVEHGETHSHAIARELGEEIGLVPQGLESLRKIGTFNEKYVVYDLYHSQETYPVLDHQHQANLSTGEDDRNKKVGCFVYGSKKNILKFLSTEKIYVYKSPDNIIGIVAIKVKDILKE